MPPTLTLSVRLQQFICSIIISLTVIAAAMASPPPQAIINKRVPHGQLSTHTLRSIFSMRLSLWPNGLPIRVIVLDDSHPVHQEFSKQVLGMFPYQLRQAWDRGVFSGTGTEPILANSVDEMITKVRLIPGAIGYRPSNYPHPGVRNATFP